jgi:hypothetical protein
MYIFIAIHMVSVHSAIDCMRCTRQSFAGPLPRPKSEPADSLHSSHWDRCANADLSPPDGGGDPLWSGPLGSADFRLANCGCAKEV